MREVVYYEAYDGKQFSNSYDCQEYELKVGQTKAAVQWYNDRLEPLVDNLESAFYCVVPHYDEFTAGYLMDACNYWGITNPCAQGAFFWDGECEDWVDFADRIEELRLQIQDLEEEQAKLLSR